MRHLPTYLAIALASTLFSVPAFAIDLKGQVLGGGQPIGNSTVTLWAAGAGAPALLGQTRSGADGSFTLNSTDPADKDAILYLTANGGQPKISAQDGDNPAIALMAVIGSRPPGTVTINEMTTVASVWTKAQFLAGTVIKGPSLSLRIAAGNVSNFVDIQTAAGGVRSKTHSTVDRRQRWLTLPHSPMCSQDALRV